MADEYYTSDSEDERYYNRPSKKLRTPGGEVASHVVNPAPVAAAVATAPRSATKPAAKPARQTTPSSAVVDLSGLNYSGFSPLNFVDGETVSVEMLRVYILPIVVSGEKEDSTGTGRGKDKDIDLIQLQAMSDPHSANNLQAHSSTLFNEQVYYFATRPETLVTLVEEARRFIAKNFEIMMNIILKFIEVFEKFRHQDDSYERAYGDFIHRFLQLELHHLLLVKGIRFSEKWISKTYIDKCYKLYLWLISTSDIAFQELVREAQMRDYQLTETMLYMLEHHSQATSSKSFNRQIVSLLIKIFHFILCEMNVRDPTVLDPYLVAGAISASQEKFRTRVDQDVVGKMQDIADLLNY